MRSGHRRDLVVVRDHEDRLAAGVQAPEQLEHLVTTLGVEGGREVLELFRRLHAGGQSILMVTHDDEVARAARARRACAMHDGRVETEAEEAAASAASVTF